MSLLKAIKAQLGLSNTPANNFTITAEADNGTLKLARGNAGATTQDILTVDSNGKPDFTQLARSMAGSGTNGYLTLPGGLIVQWGLTAPGAIATITFPTTFPNAAYGFMAMPVGGSANTTTSMAALTTSGTTIYNYTANAATGVSVANYWIAVGR